MLLVPLVALQAARVRRTTEVLPEASGPASGTAPTPHPSEPPLRLLVIGESTAAGCGAPTHEEGFAGALGRAVAERDARPVAWTVVGRRGATIRRVRHRLLPEVSGGADLAVLLIGVNDVLGRTPPAQWGDDLAAVLDALAERARRVAVAGIPSFEAFPALPRTLARFLARRALALDEAARALCATRPAVLWIGADLGAAGPEFFARDGFHPSPVGYARWADAIADRLAGTP